MNDTNVETTDNETTVAVQEEKGSGVNFSKAVVRTSHGVVDETATLARISDELRSWVAANEMQTPAIADAVKKVFDRLPAANRAMIEVGSVVQRAVELMNVEIGSETRAMKAVRNFLQGESKRFAASNGTEGQYHVRAGARGGCVKATDAYRSDFQAFQAKKAAKSA